VLPFRMRACCLGADHRRERVFLLAALGHSESAGLDGWHSDLEDGWREQERLWESMDKRDWPHVPGPEGYGSRNGIPGGLERLRCLGNSVVPQVAEYIARRLISATAPAERVT
jgi:DNA (cytosine-5)-methyltransferase 1